MLLAMYFFNSGINEYNCVFICFWMQADIVQVLMSRHKVKAETLAILTPYSAQKEEISKSLKGRGIADVTVKSITESQGVY